MKQTSQNITFKKNIVGFVAGLLFRFLEICGLDLVFKKRELGSNLVADRTFLFC